MSLTLQYVRKIKNVGHFQISTFTLYHCLWKKDTRKWDRPSGEKQNVIQMRCSVSRLTFAKNLIDLRFITNSFRVFRALQSDIFIYNPPFSFFFKFALKNRYRVKIHICLWQTRNFDSNFFLSNLPLIKLKIIISPFYMNNR